MTTPITLANGADAYTTRDGREVWLLGIDGRNISYPVVGEILNCSDWHLEQWTATGHVFSGDEAKRATDLIPKPVRHKREYWLNLYECDATAYRSKERADFGAHEQRIACIKVELDFAEGDGIA